MAKAAKWPRSQPEQSIDTLARRFGLMRMFDMIPDNDKPL
jgi:hypothetical protein